MKQYKYRICAYRTNPKSAYLDRIKVYRHATVAHGSTDMAGEAFLKRHPNQIKEDIHWIKLVETK